MEPTPIFCAANVKRQDDGTYTVVVEVSGLSRTHAFKLAEMLQQPVCDVLESFGELKQITTEIGHA